MNLKQGKEIATIQISEKAKLVLKYVHGGDRLYVDIGFHKLGTNGIWYLDIQHSSCKTCKNNYGYPLSVNTCPQCKQKLKGVSKSKLIPIEKWDEFVKACQKVDNLSVVAEAENIDANDTF